MTGIELSAAMVAQLRRKVGEATLPVVVGDMATTTVPGEFSLVYLVWNTISNLRTQGEQVACFRNAARHLGPGGRFVIELWVPPIRGLPPGQQAVPMSLDPGHLVFDTYDLVTQQCTSHHYWQHADGSTRYGSGSFRYLWPAECDLMAQLAGLVPESRWRGLGRQPVHVRERAPRLGLAQARVSGDHPDRRVWHDRRGERQGRRPPAQSR